MNATKFYGITFCLLVCSLNDLSAQDENKNWTQWRGPQRDGVVQSDPWPNSLGENSLKQLWRKELGASYSGPIVVDDVVYTTESKDATYEVVHAFKADTGEELWNTSWEGSMQVPFFAMSNGNWIRSTPAYDNGKLYVGGMKDYLVCIDVKDGKQLWTFDFVKEYKSEVPSFGFVCSPLIDGDFLYVQAGGAFVKLHKDTGKTVWKTLDDGGGMYGSAFSSPYIATVAGQKQILVQTRTTLAGVDLEDGKVMWEKEIPAFRGMNILTPTVYKDSVFTSSYGGKSFLYELNKDGENLNAEQKWVNNTQGYMSSPVIVDGHLYMHLRNQRFTCIDLESGETKWTTTPYGKYWSMITDGKHILALDERGELFLIKANPNEFELIDKQKISKQQTWAHLAMKGNVLYIRELNALSAYRWNNEAASE